MIDIEGRLSQFIILLIDGVHTGTSPLLDTKGTVFDMVCNIARLPEGRKGVFYLFI